MNTARRWQLVCFVHGPSAWIPLTALLLLAFSAAGSYRRSLSAFCHPGHHSTHEITAYLRLRLRIPQHSKKGDECQSHRAVQARELSASTVFNAFLCNLHWMNGCKENEQAAAGPAVFPRPGYLDVDRDGCVRLACQTRTVTASAHSGRLPTH